MTTTLKTSVHQCGVALLTVLFILVLMTTLVVYLVEDNHMAVRRVSNHRDFEQMYQMLVGNEQWAIKVLERDMKENKIDHLNEVWHNLLPETQVSEGKMKAVVQDLQGKFNLNNLSTKGDPWYSLFQRLLRVLDIDEGLADAVIDWIDTDFDVSGHYGAEDPEYLLVNPAYRAANRKFASTGELIWVAGFTGDIVNKLAPYVAALPTSNAHININTASIPLLRTLSPQILTESAAESLRSGRGEGGYEDIEAFLAASELAGLGDAISPLISVSSRYYEVHGQAQFGRLTGVVYSVLEKDASTQQVKVLQRRRGFS